MYQAREVSGKITGIDIASFNDFTIVFWKCSESLVFYFFSFFILFIYQVGVSDLQQVSGFLRVLRFPPPIKLTSAI